MQPLSSDTSPEAQRVFLELLRNAPPGEKLRRAFDLVQMLRQLVLSDLRRRFPQDSEDELHRRLIARLLPRDDVIRAYGFDPRAEGY